jgi:Icc-related predicted phosphoesterase
VKILIVADEESPYLWDNYRPGNLDGIDLILSAGDLKASYLSFLVTMASRPLLYVHGNHDTRYAQNPPEGCDCIDDKLVTVKGLRILGLGGSRMYNGGGHQYTERQMEKRIKHLKFKLHRSGGVDIVLAHAPVRGYGDEENIAHQGFEAFLPLLDKYKPAYFIHGHIHKSYSSRLIREREYGETKIINGSGRYVLEIEDRP